MVILTDRKRFKMKHFGMKGRYLAVGRLAKSCRKAPLQSQFSLN